MSESEHVISGDYTETGRVVARLQEGSPESPHLTNSITYEGVSCTCGESFDTLTDAKNHLQSVQEEREAPDA